MTNPGTSAPRCACGAEGELRRCAGNDGVAWRCPRCLAVLSKWLPHAELTAAGVDPERLPDWNTRAVDDRQAELSL